MTAVENPCGISNEIRCGGRVFTRATVPASLRLDEDLGLVVSAALHGAVLHHNPWGGLYETRCALTPGGDLLVMFPEALEHTNRVLPNGHYGGQRQKVNRMLAMRSRDQGRTWSSPWVPFDQEFNQHGFVPLCPRSRRDLYCFGTQPHPEHFNGIENAAIGYRLSRDDGHSWSAVRLIDPVNDPGFQGMSVQRMTETTRGSWLIGAHTGSQWFPTADGTPTTTTRQYLLRSEDRGASWSVGPRPRPGGWFVPSSNRMDELRPIALAGDEVYAQARTTTGRIWDTRSLDDGVTWSDPAPTTLVHPDAPPMLFALEDGATLLAFHHNRHTGSHFNRSAMIDRAQLWVSTSRDGGRQWSEPRFVLGNALEADPANQGNAWRDQQCSYLDVVALAGQLHLFLPHRWQRALHLSFPVAALSSLPSARELQV